MEVMEAILSRRTIRKYTGEPLSETALGVILEAGNAAPAGKGQFKNQHITVIRSRELLDSIDENAASINNTPGKHPLFEAPVFIVVSTAAEGDVNVKCSNAAIIVQNMALAATGLGIGCCHIWGAIRALNKNPELVARLGLPEGFTPSCGILLGVMEGEYEKRELPAGRVPVSYID